MQHAARTRAWVLTCTVIEGMRVDSECLPACFVVCDCVLLTS